MALAVAVAGAAWAGCGGDSGTGPKQLGPPASLTIVGGDQQQAAVGTELPAPLVVKVIDANGNAIPGQTVNFRVTAGGGSVFTGASNTNADGIAQERWTLGTLAGQDQTVEARAVHNGTGQAVVFATFHATALAGAAKALAVTGQPPVTTRSGELLSPQPAVQLVDQYGNAVKQSGVPVTVAASPSGHTLDGTVTIATNAQGLAQWTDLKLKGSSGAVTLTFSAGSLTSVTSNQFTLGAGSPATLEPLVATTLAGIVGMNVSPLPAVVVKDAAGNPVAGVSVQFSVSAGGGTIAPASVATDASGDAALTSWVLGSRTGTYTVTASTPAIPGTAVGFTATAQASTGTQLTIVSGNNTSAPVGAAAPPLVVKVTDSQANAAPGVVVNWSVTSGGGSLSATTSTTDTSGRTSVVLTLPNTAGIIKVSASLGNSATVTFTVTGTAGQATNLAKIGGDGQSATVGSVVSTPPSVRVSDGNGNAVAGTTVTFAVASGGGSITGASATSDANGTATVGSWTLGTTAGVNTLTASLGTNRLTFTATGNAGAPASLVILQQPPSSVSSGIAMSPQPRIGLRDQYGNAVSKSGVSVAAASTATTVTLSGQSATTDATGVATFTSLTASGPATTFAIMFSSSGLTAATSNNITLASASSYTWVGGDAAGPRDWFNPRNWSPAAVPGASDSASIPFVSATLQPQLTRDASIRAISIDVGSALDVQSYTLSPYRVYATGPISGTGTVAMSIDGGTIAGQLPNLRISATTNLSGATFVSGSATITSRVSSSNASSSYNLTVNGDLSVVGPAAHLSLPNYGALTVGSTLTLDGADPQQSFPFDRLTNLNLKGDLVVGSTYTTRVIPPQTGLYLIGTGPQRIRGSGTFAKNDSRYSTFAVIEIRNDGRNIAFDIPVTDAGEFRDYAAVTVSYPPNDTLAVAGGVNANSLSDLSSISTLELFGPNALPCLPMPATQQPGRILISGQASSGCSHVVAPVVVTGSLTARDNVFDSTVTITGASASLSVARVHFGGTTTLNGSSATITDTVYFAGNVVIGSGQLVAATNTITRFVGSTNQSISGYASFWALTVAKGGGALDFKGLSGDIRSDLKVESPTQLLVTAGSRLRIGGLVNSAVGSDLSSIGTLELYGNVGFGQINGTPPGRVEISGKVTQTGTNSLSVPLLVSGSFAANGIMTLGSSLTVQGANAHLIMLGSGQTSSPILTVTGDATFDGGYSDVDLQRGALDLKGNLTVGNTYSSRAFYPINGIGLPVAFTVQFSGTSARPQSVSGATLITNGGNDSNLSYVKILAGADVSISDAYLGWGLDQHGTLTVPAGKRLVIGNQPGTGAFLHLFSGSVTTVQGALINNGTCTADAGATYSGFTCP